MSESVPLNGQIVTGQRLYGDDFGDSEIEEWYAQEAEAYYQLQSEGETGASEYEYRRLNEFHAFRFVRERFQGSTLLAFGAGHGEEVAPLLESSQWQCTFVESSEGFLASLATRFPASTRIRATESGMIQVSSDSVDAITCFGVLHHIPNVSTVLGEFYRVLRTGGVLMIREPGSSMGDWRTRRHGLTKNERGIGRGWLTAKLDALGFRALQPPRPCLFMPFHRLIRWLGLGAVGNSRSLVLLDYMISLALVWNDHYWRDSLLKKLAPSSYFYLAEKGTTAPVSHKHPL